MSSISGIKLPATQIGVLSTPDTVTVRSFPVPRPGPGEVLVANVAVASNPKDYKVPNRNPKYAAIEGNDVAGYIVAVGDGVEEYKGGERVAAFSKMATNDNKYGAYAQFTVAPAITTFPIASSTTFEEASTLPLAIMTAASGLFRKLKLPEPPQGPKPASNNSKNLTVIVNGASSSVGAFAVQLAKRAGLYVIGIAGSSSKYVEELGADDVLDYRKYKTQEELEAALLDAAKKAPPLAGAFDGVTLNGSSVTLARVISKAAPGGKGRVTFVLNVSDEERKQIPEGVSIERTGVNEAYTSDQEWAGRFYRQITHYLVPSEENNPPLKGNNVTIITGGLAGVPEGIARLKAGKVHAEKFVYRIRETPGADNSVLDALEKSRL